MYRKTLKMLHIAGTVLYVGGIITHIILPIQTMFDIEGTYYARTLMEAVAEIMIIPGMILAVGTGFLMFFQTKKKPVWLKAKLILSIFLVINGLAVLTPLMYELTALSIQMKDQGAPLPVFIEMAQREGMLGAANGIPLLIVILLGIYKPTRKNKSSKKVGVLVDS